MRKVGRAGAIAPTLWPARLFQSRFRRHRCTPARLFQRGEALGILAFCLHSGDCHPVSVVTRSTPFMDQALPFWPAFLTLKPSSQYKLCSWQFGMCLGRIKA